MSIAASALFVAVMGFAAPSVTDHFLGGINAADTYGTFESKPSHKTVECVYEGTTRPVRFVVPHYKGCPTHSGWNAA